MVTVTGVKAQQVAIHDSVIKIENNVRPAAMIAKWDTVSTQYARFPRNQIDFGLTGNDYCYLLIKLSAVATLYNQYISIDNTSIDTVDIYRIFQGGKSQLLYRGGTLVAYTNKLYNWHTAAVAINTVPSFYLIALKASQKNINVRYQVLDKDELQLQYQNYEKVVYAYAGIVLMIVVVIAVVFFLFKKPEFGLYAGYIICFSGWVLAHYGRIFPLLYPGVPVINLVVKPVTSLGACFFLIAVLRLVFQQQLQHHPKALRLIRITLYGLVILIAMMLLLLFQGLNAGFTYLLVVVWHIGMVISILEVVYIPLLFLKTSKTARIFLVAILAVSLTVSIQIIATLGYINSFFINEHGMTVGSLLEIIIMAFGLFYSLLEQMKDKEKQLLVLEQEQTETLKRLVTVQDHERKRIAADLHDNIGPLLAALKINFGRIVNTNNTALLNGVVGKTEGIIDDAISEIRNVAHNMMPKSLSSNGLISTLKEYLESIQQLYNKEVQFQHEVESVLSIELQTNLYRIICELVLNAARHSKGEQITVGLTATQSAVFVCIADNGQGFDHLTCDQKNSLGLQSAESRVHYLKGKFVLQSASNLGTRINIEIPLQFNEAHVHRF